MFLSYADVPETCKCNCLQAEMVKRDGLKII